MSEKKKRLRRGIKIEVRQAFDLAVDMAGSFAPEDILPERRRLLKLCNEVLRLLKAS